LLYDHHTSPAGSWAIQAALGPLKTWRATVGNFKVLKRFLF
jgi:hypothetical protein